ncbi:ATP-binding protein [Salidesulfovibrio onnuriiensis]|uniref:ATP-binding protein n=1 Tax=Salidesulfovibrio onnuriiensis TaxID=2583823 RepID=UPI0011CA63F4|nr:ATP-binding protein [Salidesulfovibrio onnuriiensis]
MAAMSPMTGIFKRTFLLVFCVFGLIAAITSGMAAYFLYERMADEFQSKGLAIAESIAKGSQVVLLTEDASAIQSSIDHFLGIEGVKYIFVMDSRNDVIAHTFVPVMPDALRERSGLRRSAVREIDVQGYGPVMDINAPILEGVAGYVHVGMDMGLLETYFWKVFANMQLVLLGIFLACMVAVYYSVQRIARPLTELSRYAARLAKHDFSAEIDIVSEDEVGMLARTMQSMSQELSALFGEMNAKVEKATEEVRRNLSYRQAIINNLADGLLVTDRDAKITLVNPAMREYFDLRDLECEGELAERYFPEELVSLVVSVQSLKEGVVTAEVPLSGNRTGKALASRIWLDETQEKSLGGVILVRDITHEKALDRLKTEFISTVSHELRTPMTSVLGFTKIIRKKLERDVFPELDPDSEKAARAVEQVQDNIGIIVTEAERLTELINDVLDIAKMESGKAQWRDRLLSMGDVAAHSVRSVRGMCADKGVRVELEVEESLPMVFGDSSRLVQVMVNLLSNAIKFMDEGVITCRVRRQDSFVLVSVVDQGAGIGPDQLPFIFEKFKQVGDTLTEKPQGTGLGLPICRQIVTRHGGEIWAESVAGMGSTFYFTLPIAEDFSENVLVSDEKMNKIVCEEETDILMREGQAMMVETGEEACDMPPLILVVDDDPSLGKYLKQLFRDAGFRVLVAQNGRIALSLARQHLPSLITMDLMMPEMDGKAAIHCLRSNPFTRHIPILVVTALSEADSAGGDAAVLKPVDEEQLLETVNALLRDHDVSRSCIVLGDRASYAFDDDLTVICPNRITFCPPDEVWDHVREGFRGFVFVPSEMAGVFDLEALSRFSGVQVLILPGGEDYK